MTSRNINKFVRGNLNLKPWVLSKNPTDIVKSYVQMLYQKNPNNFKKDIRKPRSEHQTPFQTLKPPQERFTIPIVNKPKSKLPSNGYKSPTMTAKNSFTSSPKKFLKSPNFKIYNNRKFTSSASSSSASIFRKSNEERRRMMYKPAVGMQFRNFAGSAAMPSTDFYNNPSVSKYIAPTRLYNQLTNQLKTLEITNAICRDLMSVDDMVKQKIRVNRPKVPAAEKVELNSEEILVPSSLKGRIYPSMLHMNKTNIQKSGILNKRRAPPPSMPVRQKSHGGRIVGPSPSVRLENSRHQLPNGVAYSGALSTRTYYLKNSPKPEVCRPGPSQKEERYPLDFVCRSRSRRSGNSRSSNNVSQSFSRF